MSGDPRPSKTQRKKAMLALQDLGTELVALNEEQLMSLGLPENLCDALIAAKHIAGFEARRRQLQYIGRLMRTIDPEPIRVHLAALKASSRGHAARLHELERWRERLLADASAMAEFSRTFPGADMQRLHALIRSAQHERVTAAPPRSYRGLFRLLRDILQLHGEERSESREE
jgi:ribosome-associated protein